VKIDFEQIRELLTVVAETDITELTIESGEERVTVKKSGPAGQFVAMAPIAKPQPEIINASPDAVEPKGNETNGLLPITSPMVGTFYRSPSPSAPSFVDIGDSIAIGQTVCIIEAMKLMNDLPSEISGRVVKVCVENGTTVEYGQPLFMVDPRG